MKSAPKRVEVSTCGSCPFAWDGNELEDRWRCCAADRGHEFRALSRAVNYSPYAQPPPKWCPLRHADHLVTLRAQ